LIGRKAQNMKKSMNIEDIQKRIQEVIEQIEEIAFSENKAQEVTIDTLLNIRSDLLDIDIDIEEARQEEYIEEYEEYIDTEYEKNMPCDNTGYCSNTCPMYYQCNT